MSSLDSDSIASQKRHYTLQEMERYIETIIKASPYQPLLSELMLMQAVAMVKGQSAT
jgi:hypothetical protein